MVTSEPKDWTDDQWHRLETYLTEFGDLKPSNRYLYQFQLEFLSQLVHSDAATITENVREILHEHPSIANIDFSWETSRNRLLNEVDNIILSLELQPFEKQLKRSSPPAEQPEPPRAEVPVLTKTQRRMSLDLMRSRPALTPTVTAAGLSRPALPSTSTVNVLTKAEIRNVSAGTAKPDAKKRFSFNSIMPRRTASEARPAPEPEPEVSAETRMARRMSLVGENLPSYIRKQIASPEPRLVKKKQSRMQNVLSNSMSLYAHKDSDSAQSGSSDYVHESEDSDSDKEYISPNSLTRAYGAEHDEPDEHDLDDADFVNVNDSYDELHHSHTSDDNDDYLFTI